MHIGEVGIEEPMWVCLSFMRRVHREQRFIEHPIGIREITGLTLTTSVPLRSNVSQKIVESGILTFRCRRPNAILAASSGFDQPSMIALASSRILELGGACGRVADNTPKNLNLRFPQPSFWIASGVAHDPKVAVDRHFG
jgi:hypothetical protein